MRDFRDDPMPGDPLGLTFDQRLISDMTESIIDRGERGKSVNFAGIEVALACELCRRHECVPGKCLSSIR